jgi:hypothetical protein
MNRLELAFLGQAGGELGLARFSFREIAHTGGNDGARGRELSRTSVIA